MQDVLPLGRSAGRIDCRCAQEHYNVRLRLYTAIRRIFKIFFFARKSADFPSRSRTLSPTQLAKFVAAGAAVAISSSWRSCCKWFYLARSVTPPTRSCRRSGVAQSCAGGCVFQKLPQFHSAPANSVMLILSDQLVPSLQTDMSTRIGTRSFAAGDSSTG